MTKKIYLLFLVFINTCYSHPIIKDKINIPVSYPFYYSVVEQGSSFLITLSTNSFSVLKHKPQCLQSMIYKKDDKLELYIDKKCYINFIPIVNNKNKFSLDVFFYPDSEGNLHDANAFLNKAYEDSVRVNVTNRPHIDAWEKFNNEKAINPPNKEDFIIVLDPGHGGFDPGAVSIWGMEKNYNLLFAKKLQSRLNKKPGYRVFLTRDDDTYITLDSRLKYTNYHDADLFISFHIDSNTNQFIRGSRTFILSESGSYTKKQTFDNNINAIKFDLQQASTLFKSAVFAYDIDINLAKILDDRFSGISYGGFAVLKSPTTASILLELGFISNKKDMRILNDILEQDRIIDTIILAIERYVLLQK